MIQELRDIAKYIGKSLLKVHEVLDFVCKLLSIDRYFNTEKTSKIKYIRSKSGGLILVSHPVKDSWSIQFYEEPFKI